MAGTFYVGGGTHFEWASKLSYYFNTNYGIRKPIMEFGSCQVSRQKLGSCLLICSDIIILLVAVQMLSMQLSDIETLAPYNSLIQRLTVCTLI